MSEHRGRLIIRHALDLVKINNLLRRAEWSKTPDPAERVSLLHEALELAEIEAPFAVPAIRTLYERAVEASRRAES